MTEKFRVGERVVVKLAGDGAASVRDAALESLDGQVGEVAGFHSISPMPGQVFYIYTVSIGPGNKKIVLHEDEIETRQPQPSMGGRGRH